MNREKEELKYQILHECAYSAQEEFFVLAMDMNEDEVGLLIEVLYDLVKSDLLVVDRGGSRVANLSIEDLHSYRKQRIEAGENMGECPSVCKEYSFTITKKGFDFLQKK